MTATAPRLFLIDGSGYIFRAYHALPPLTRASDGAPVGAVAGFCNMLWKFLGDMQAGEAPTHLAVIFDASEKTFRNQLYPAYKAHRPPTPEDLVPQFPLMRDAVRAFNIACVEMNGFEADDLIATYARQAAAEGATVKIVSSDKDLMQLVTDGVIALYDPMKQKPLGLEAVMEKFGVTPDKVIDAQALIGDSSDNVPGAPGIGPKTAAELIAQFGSLEQVIARAGEIKQPKRREAIQNNVEQIRLSKMLVTLKDDVPVTAPWRDFAVRAPEQAALLAFLDAMEFRTLGRRVREYGAKPQGGAAPAPALESFAPPAPPSNGEAAVNYDAYVTVRELGALETWIARARGRRAWSRSIPKPTRLTLRARAWSACRWRWGPTTPVTFRWRIAPRPRARTICSRWKHPRPPRPPTSANKFHSNTRWPRSSRCWKMQARSRSARTSNTISRCSRAMASRSRRSTTPC